MIHLLKIWSTVWLRKIVGTVLCESTQAGSWKKHKITVETQRLNLFLCLLTGGSWITWMETSKWEPLGSVHPSEQWTCCLHPFIKGLCMCSLQPCWALFIFDLLSPNTGSSSTSVRVSLSLSKHLHHLHTEILLSKERTNNSRRNMRGFPHCYSPGLCIPRCKATWKNLPSSSLFFWFWQFPPNYC